MNLRSDRVAQSGEVEVGVERGVDLDAAVHDALLVDIADIVIEPVAAGHIGKREPYRGSRPGRGDRGTGGDGRRRQDSLMPGTQL